MGFNDNDDASDPKAALMQKIRDAALRKRWQGNMPGEDVDIPQNNAAGGQPSQAGMPVGDAQQEAQNEQLLKAIRMKMIAQDQQAAMPQQQGSPSNQDVARFLALQKMQRGNRGQ